MDTAKLEIEIQKNKDELVTNEEVEQKVRALMQGEEGQCIKRNVVKMQRNARKAVAHSSFTIAALEYRDSKKRLLSKTLPPWLK